MFDMFLCQNWSRLVHSSHLLLRIKGKTTQCTAGKHFKADFLKMASATHATFKNTSHQHFIE